VLPPVAESSSLDRPSHDRLFEHGRDILGPSTMLHCSSPSSLCSRQIGHLDASNVQIADRWGQQKHSCPYTPEHVRCPRPDQDRSRSCTTNMYHSSSVPPLPPCPAGDLGVSFFNQLIYTQIYIRNSHKIAVIIAAVAKQILAQPTHLRAPLNKLADSPMPQSPDHLADSSLVSSSSVARELDDRSTGPSGHCSRGLVFCQAGQVVH
jgi:hypothetical protein